jgi:hypothetical protein
VSALFLQCRPPHHTHKIIAWCIHASASNPKIYGHGMCLYRRTKHVFHQRRFARSCRSCHSTFQSFCSGIGRVWSNRWRKLARKAACASQSSARCGRAQGHVGICLNLHDDMIPQHEQGNHQLAQQKWLRYMSIVHIWSLRVHSKRGHATTNIPILKPPTSSCTCSHKLDLTVHVILRLKLVTCWDVLCLTGGFSSLQRVCPARPPANCAVCPHPERSAKRL